MAPSCITRRALDQLHLLRALDHLDAVDHVGGVDIARLREARASMIVEQRVGHLIGADIADGAVARTARAPWRRARDRSPWCSAPRHSSAWCMHAPCTPRAGCSSPCAAVMRPRCSLPQRSLADHRHLVVAREHHRVGIAVGRRHVGEIAHIAAHVIVVVLHQQHVDLSRSMAARTARQRRSSSAVEIGVFRRSDKAMVQSPQDAACARY